MDDIRENIDDSISTKEKNQETINSSDRRLEKDHDAYFNAQFGAVPEYIEPGHFVCGDNIDEMLVATIGSGIAVTIHDKDLHIGGLAYLLIPDTVLRDFPNLTEQSQKDLKKAFKPLEDCIGKMKRMGAGKNRIRIRVMGGTEYSEDKLDRGTKNYIIVKEYLAKKKLVVMSEDLAGPYIRRIHFFPSSGRAVRRVLRREADFASIHEDELQYQTNF